MKIRKHVIALWTWLSLVASSLNWAPASELVLMEEDYTLSSQDSPFEISHLFIRDATFFLEPGAHLVFTEGNTSEQIRIENGRMVASGTEDDPVHIELAFSNDVLSVYGYFAAQAAMALDHTILDLKGNGLYFHLSGTHEHTGRTLVMRNCIVRGAEFAPPSWLKGSALITGGLRMDFEDTLFVSPRRTVLQAIDLGGSLRFDRCVFIGDHPTEGAYGIRLYRANQTIVRIEDCRFDGYSYAIALEDTVTYPDFVDVLDISGSDFSGSAHLLWASDLSWPFVVNIRDSHLVTSVLDNPASIDIRFEVLRCFIESGTPLSNKPSAHFVSNPRTESPFHHVSFDADAFATQEDIHILAGVLAGAIDPSSVPGQEHLDIDGDGDITMRDLALLRAYVDGTLLFLPKVP